MNLYLKRSPKIPKNQVNRSLLCVASPRLSKTGEGALQYIYNFFLFKHFIRMQFFLCLMIKNNICFNVILSLIYFAGHMSLA